MMMNGDDDSDDDEYNDDGNCHNFNIITGYVQPRSILSI